DDAQRGLRALAHHFAQLAREDQPAAARRARRLDEQDVAAHGGPGETGGDARHARSHRHLALELARAQDARAVGGVDTYRALRALGEAHRGIAQGLADLSLQAAHTGLARVVLYDGAQRIVGDLDLVRLEPVGLELALDEIAPRNLQLLRG